MPAQSLTNVFACIHCMSSNVTTVDSRPADKPAWRRRRKKCNHCGSRWSTIELPLDEIASMIGVVNKLEQLRDLSATTAQVINELMAARHDLTEIEDGAHIPPRVEHVSMQTTVGFPGVIEEVEQ